MCTRFYVEPDDEDIREIIAQIQGSKLADRFVRAGSAVRTNGEIRPTDVVPVIAPDRAGEPAVFPMKWGFRLRGNTLAVNARTETAAEKPSFREAWVKRRCVVPASWYFEWEHLADPSGRTKTGDRYAIQPRNAHVTWLCGLYRMEDGFPVFAVLTREPSEELRRIHDRMPLILPKEKIREWIRPGARAEDLLPYALTDMVMEKGEKGP